METDSVQGIIYTLLFNMTGGELINICVSIFVICYLIHLSFKIFSSQCFTELLLPFCRYLETHHIKIAILLSGLLYALYSFLLISLFIFCLIFLFLLFI